MRSFSYYLSYWPVLGGALLFFCLGLWLHLTAAQAMELAPKPLSWVRNYRRSGFPFRQEVLGRPRVKAAVVCGAVALGLASGFLHVVAGGLVFCRAPWIYFRSSYGWIRVLLITGGTSAVFFLLHGLFDSLYTALLGALLFAAAPVRTLEAECVLAVCLLLLFLYLRWEKPGFPGEFFYLGALLVLGLLLSLEPAAGWLIPALVLAHWYRLLGYHRSNKLTPGLLTLALAAALVVWMLTGVLAALLRRFVLAGLSFRELASLMNPIRIRHACGELVQAILTRLLRLPTRGMTLYPMVDGALFGLGFWGCFAAWTMARKRRSVRGVFSLAVLGILVLVWLLSGRYLAGLGLTLTAACVLKNADLGGKRRFGLLMVLLAVCFDLLLLAAAWQLQVPQGLLERLL